MTSYDVVTNGNGKTMRFPKPPTPEVDYLVADVLGRLEGADLLLAEDLLRALADVGLKVVHA